MGFKSFLSFYRPKYAVTVVYMLQACEYQVRPYLKWFWRTNDFGKVMYRKTLVKTKPAKLLLAAIGIGMLAQFVLAIHYGIVSYQNGVAAEVLLATGIFLLTPMTWAHLIVLPLEIGRLVISKPKQKVVIKRSRKTFANQKAIKIAIAGSYGKTTMKEILLTVLSEGKRVAATPANKNVAISHAYFANKLKGDEDVLIIEYGEGAPGDVAKFARITKPDIGIITGLAPAHLDRYKTLQATGQDIFSLSKFVKPKDLYINGDSETIKPFIENRVNVFDHSDALGWSIEDIKVSINNLSFTMKKGKDSLKLVSQLLGRHQVAPLALAAALAIELGLSKEQVKAGIAKIAPFEHRMKPYMLSGAWILDDTYNGNIEGMKAGLEMLAELPAKRKIYITPGLVDQGKDEAKIHNLVLMQNDWTDNYN
jgi:UDP-N-acetylmuramoyl-tripeptide--D-alanyl-D-alanine ligase